MTVSSFTNFDHLGGPIERQSFFAGQRLFATDLQEIEAFNRRMRWLHNMSLHQAGIGSGLAVFGKRDDRVVTVQPGYAIDAYGREIILGETQTEAVPPVAGHDGEPAVYDLTIGYPEDDDLEEVETRGGICLDRGAVRLAEEPVFCWVPKTDPDPALRRDVETGVRLVLARVSVADCKLKADLDLDLARRRSARPPTRPYVAAGIEDAPDWKPWKVNNSVIGLMAGVDTRVGGFASTPTYTARLDVESGPNDRQSKGLIEGPIYVTDTDRSTFRVHVMLLDQQSGGPGGSITVDGTFSTWRIVWFGVEG